MNYTVDTEQKNLAVITVNIDKEDWLKDIEAAKEATKSDNEEEIRKYAISSASAYAIEQAISENKLKLATEPAIQADSTDEGGIKITLTCPLVPEVTLGKYTGFNIPAEVVSVEDEEVLQEINQELAKQNIWTEVPAGTEAQNGNRVIIDFVGEKDGVPFDGGAGNDYPLVLGSNTFIPGFEDQLIGIKAGEQKDVEVSFPEDYFEKSLAGAPVVFHVTCKAVQQEEKAELTDEFIQKLKLEDIKTVDELKAKVKDQMLVLKKQEAANKQGMEILSKVVEDAKVEVPEVMINNQVSQHLTQIENSIKQYGMNIEQYFEMTGQTADELKKSLIPQAETEIKQALILEAIAEKENISAQQEEIEQEYQFLASMYNMPAQQLQMMIPQGAVAYQILQKKAMEFLQNHND